MKASLRRLFLRELLILATASLFLLMLSGTAMAAQASFKLAVPYYAVDNNLNEMDAAPFVIEGRFFVPVRYAALVCGIQNKNITYDSLTRTVRLVSDDGVEVQLVIGSKTISISGEQSTMDVAPLMVKGRVYLPIRYISKAFGRKITWDSKNMIVTVEMEDYLSKVMDGIQAENYDAAINLCDKFTEISPNDFRSHLFKGVAYFQLADYEKAIECYDKSISVNPKNPLTYIVRAEARWPLYLNQTDDLINVQMLIDDVSKAIELVEDPMFYFRRAGLYNYSGEYDKAIADCDKAISLDSQYKAAYYRRAIALALRDGNTAFKAEVEAILNQFPDDEWAKNSMELLSSEKPFKLDVTDW